MTTVDPFLIPIPKKFAQDPETLAYFEFLHNHLRLAWARSGGSEDVIGDTADVVVTQGEKLDLVTVTQNVNLDALEAESAASAATLALIATASPTYAPSNDGTDRTWDADAAAGAITSPPTQAEVENIRDAVLEASDVLATFYRDLKAKGIFG